MILAFITLNLVACSSDRISNTLEYKEDIPNPTSEQLFKHKYGAQISVHELYIETTTQLINETKEEIESNKKNSIQMISNKSSESEIKKSAIELSELEFLLNYYKQSLAKHKRELGNLMKNSPNQHMDFTVKTPVD